ncbi:AAA family ATPase [Funiculus sociatus GB2-A5]|uniref:AAA family ATPase n=1 Tax=Funiculus sociatus GB2-A5 TaxID=2933946 RepID=A0ABV0JMI8_9CYAN|nr:MULTISPECIES: ATP-binding protein [unclassified Trichocoleus]MBD1906582.1 AAA family ATPase [Trichocoleus sp. FACHB-832]MBD2063086.1 AAA family ATPase [Trichocoleus sp. FACHB-6]
MTSSNDAIASLREALKFSPDNVPLRQHLAETLLSLGQPEEAEQEYRQALVLSPENQQLKLGLARAFYQQGKYTQALVIVEDQIKRLDCPAGAFLLHARLLLNVGAVEQAVRQYRRAVETDPAVKDADFAERLGIGAEEDVQEVVDGKIRAGLGDFSTLEDTQVEKPAIAFADVGGMEAVKDEIRLKIIYPLKQPELYKAYGKAIGGGILMYGPPGCGKTYLARATAGEINSGFLSVGINDVLDMWLGNSERNLHDLFEQARRNQPCVLFFDEVDALAASRADLRQNSSRMVINQFLSELDGVRSSNEGVLILAATNAPWHLDSAFRRPGRFDRILFVPPPDAEARAAILRLLCRGKPVEDIDYDHLAKKTENFSGADLMAVVDVAIEKKLAEAMKVGIPKPLTTKDLASAAGGVKPSTKEWFSTARNYALYANEGGLYDDILKYMKF